MQIYIFNQMVLTAGRLQVYLLSRIFPTQNLPAIGVWQERLNLKRLITFWAKNRFFNVCGNHEFNPVKSTWKHCHQVQLSSALSG